MKEKKKWGKQKNKEQIKAKSVNYWVVMKRLLGVHVIFFK